MSQILSQEEVAQYKAQGYSEEDIQKAVNEIVSENPAIAKAKQIQTQNTNKSHSFFPGMHDENLIKMAIRTRLNLRKNRTHAKRGQTKKRKRIYNMGTI